MPFNWKTPFGYVINIIIQSGDVYCLALCGQPNICLFVSSTWLLRVMIADVSDDLSLLNENDQYWAENRIEMKALLCDIIRNISDAKEVRK